MFSLKNRAEEMEKAVEFKDDSSEFDALLIKVRQVCGIDLETKRMSVRPKIVKFCKSNGLKNYSELTSKMDLNLPIRQDFFDLITVCETYFYREIKQLKELINILRMEPDKRRILCAPCSSGEEVYSIIMLASEAGISDVHVTGIDINAEIIKKAKEGKYSQRSLYNLNDALIRKYFTKENDEYLIKKQFFKNTRFDIVNVFDRKFFDLGKFDIILSRNMMIYFNEEYKYKLVDNFSKSLKDGGMFFAGHADLVPFHQDLKKIYTNSCTYYIKDNN